MKPRVVAVVSCGNYILIGKKNPESESDFAGLWHLLGEKLKENENPRSALRRGLKEEANLRAIIGRSLGESNHTGYGPAEYFFCKTLSYKVIPSEEIVEFRWIPKGPEIYEYCNPLVASFWPPLVHSYIIGKDIYPLDSLDILAPDL